MERLNKFYSSVFGRVLVDFCIGLLVGYLIYWWRGNERAPFMCAGTLAIIGYLKATNKWPNFRKK
jgi:hypothetical protein